MLYAKCAFVFIEKNYSLQNKIIGVWVKLFTWFFFIISESEWHKLEESSLILYQRSQSKKRQWYYSLSKSFKKKTLILDLEGVLLATFELHPELSRPSWTEYMRLVEDDNEIHAVRPDAEVFLEFCFAFFEVWIWSCHRLQKAQHILKKCFPTQSHRFNTILDKRCCQDSTFMIGYKKAYHKNLPIVWKLFDHLDGSNTLIFDNSPYRVMWNMRGTFLIFPKFWNQSSDLLGSFLKHGIIPWLCGWLYVKDKREYTATKFANFHFDPETKYILDCYMSQRI